MKKKLFSMLGLLVIVVLMLCSCIKDEEYNYLNETPTQYREIEETTKDETIKNLRDFSTKPYVSAMAEQSSKRTKFINEEKTLMYDRNNDGNVKEIRYKDLVGIINEELSEIKYKGYVKNEKLKFNYTETKNDGKSIYANFIDVSTKEEQTPDDYTKKIEKTINDTYTKEIIDITYLSRENGTYQKGVFKSREPNKKEELKYEETFDDNEINKLLDPVHYSFGNIERFYDYKDRDNFEASCKGNLLDILGWTQITDGIELLQDFTATITRTQIVKGEEVEIVATLRPLVEQLKKDEITENSFYYDMIVKDGDIKISVDITEAIKNYFRVFEQYRVVKAQYEIEIGHR